MRLYFLIQNLRSHIWCTISPADDLIYNIVWYALGPDSALPHKEQIPSGEFRLKLLAKHPVAAALHFEWVLHVVIERVIGWNQKNSRPYRKGGLFGVPKAWLRVVEEHSKLTPHAHFLIWIYGHGDFHMATQNQLRKAREADRINHLSPAITTTFSCILFVFCW